MSEPAGNLRCTLGCWAMGALAGVLAAIMLKLLGGLEWTGAIFSGLLLFAVLAFILPILICRPLPTMEEAKARHTADVDAARARSQIAGSGASVGASSGTASASTGSGATAATAAGAAAAAAAAGSAAAGSSGASTGSDADAAREAADAAAEKAAADRAAAEAAEKAAADRAAAEAAEKAAADRAAAETAAADAAAEKAAADRAAAEAAEKAAADAKAAEEAAAASASATAGGAASGDYDGDGIVEGTAEGVKPATLEAARGGVADDLKRIKGVGPKMEKLCNSLGFYHFDQIASWTPDEVAWVDANLEGFKGRVTRDEWVSQAKLLAAGGETEFSKKVDDGDVY